MNELKFSDISPQKENLPQDNEQKLSRRKFLRRSLSAGVGLTAIAYGADKLLNQDNDLTVSDEENRLLKNKIAELEAKNEPTKEQEKIDQENIDVIGKTFAQQIETDGYITLDTKTKKTIYEHWHNKYKPGGKNYEDGLIAGLDRMKPWIAEIKKVFSRHGIPEDFVYLAIPESHFDMNAVSPKQATGPYQITEHTARLQKFNLIVTDAYDERNDPIRSAELCAKHLRHSFDAFGHDWQLALMDYNGGLTGAYIEYVKTQESFATIIPQGTHSLQKNKTLTHVALQYDTSVTLLKNANDLSDENVRKLQPATKLIIPQKRSITFEGFNAWLEENINRKIKNQSEHNYYTVRRGDTIGEIAQRYSINAEILKAINNLDTNDIRTGQKLHIPELDKEKTKKILDHISDFRENINYPEKFYAIIDIMEKEKLMTQFDNATTKYKEIPVPKVSKVKFSYTFGSGDTISRMILHLKKQYPQCTISGATLTQMIIRANNITDVRKIGKRQVLSITFPLEHSATLTSIAEKYDIDMATLQKLNPAVRNTLVPLPENIYIRLPK